MSNRNSSDGTIVDSSTQPKKQSPAKLLPSPLLAAGLSERDFEERVFFLLRRVWQKELNVSYRKVIMKAKELIDREVERLNSDELKK